MVARSLSLSLSLLGIKILRLTPRAGVLEYYLNLYGCEISLSLPGIKIICLTLRAGVPGILSESLWLLDLNATITSALWSISIVIGYILEALKK
jgi:hypothetical protein